MEKARDSGMAAITSKVQLAIDTAGQAPPSFIMYLPVFAPGQPRDTVAQRRTNLIGWVYAAFHMSDFMASLYGKQAPGLALAIYDDVNLTAAALLYRTPDEALRRLPGSTAPLTAKEYMVVAGHSWTLSLNTQSEFEDRFGRSAVTLIAAAGIGLSLSLALLVWFMVTGRERALRLAAEMTDELRHMAQHDSLTHLPNRALFSDRLNHELARARRNGGRCALMFLDLDDFKLVNDHYGHAVGDHLLCEFAQRLQACIRAADTVGRLGGDEFVVLMPELKESNAAIALAEKIRTALHKPFLVDGHSLLISCSLGIAIYPEDGTDEISLTKNADHAMYRAKEGGGDGVRISTVQQ
jgi:diguanylate cyclase (GGDEF)-like protein